MSLAESEHITFPDHGFGFQEQTREGRSIPWLFILCLRFSDSAVVIDEYEDVGILRVLIITSSLVPRAEIAFRVMVW